MTAPTVERCAGCGVAFAADEPRYYGKREEGPRHVTCLRTGLYAIGYPDRRRETEFERRRGITEGLYSELPHE